MQDMAKAFGGYGERVESPDQIIPAIQRGIQKTEDRAFLPCLSLLPRKKRQISSF